MGLSTATRFLAAALLVLAALAVFSGTASAGACPNEASPGFRSYLPDCRAYELVTPPYKEGFLVSLSGISADGSQLVAQSFGTIASPEDISTLPEPYLVGRDEGMGWTPSPLSFPYAQFSSYELALTTATLGRAVWFAERPPLTQGGLSPLGMYAGSPAGPGPIPLLGPAEPPHGEARPRVVAAASDLHRVLFVMVSFNPGAPTPLWPGDTTASGGRPSLYEYTGTDNEEPRLVGISDTGAPAHIADSHLISTCGTDLGGGEGDAYNALSEDGETAFFTARAGSQCEGAGPPVNELFARIAGTRTVAISEPDPGDCECYLSTPAAAEFQGASEDGTKVFFTTTQNLLPGTTGTAANLYEYDFAAPEHHRLIRISQKTGPGDGGVLGVARVSEDGSHVYFVATEPLAGANREGHAPTPGAPNLYVATTTCTPTCEPHTTFVATLSAEDSTDWMARDLRPVQASADGRFLAFQSVADLTPDQEGRPEAGQIFEYDAAQESLVRVSRGQQGFNEDGNSSSFAATMRLQGWEEDFDQPDQRYRSLAITREGAVFFSSDDALTPAALPGAVNIYEYNNGDVALISDGHDSTTSEGFPALEFIGTDEAGQNAFFQTADRLLPQDTDDQIDTYDARANGGIPAPLEHAPCSGDTCHAAPAPPPALLTPLTSTVTPQPPAAPAPPPAVHKPTVKHKHKKKHKRRTHKRRPAKRKPAHR